MSKPNKCICGKRPDIVGRAALQVKCIWCQRSGPARATEEVAIADWNRQTAAPELLEAAKSGLAFANALAVANGPVCNQPSGKPYLDSEDSANRDLIIAAIVKAEPKP